MCRVETLESLGGSGFGFEDRVGAYLAAAILAGEPVIGGLGVPVRVDFQVRADRWRLDDMLVWFRGRNSECRRWAVSIKSDQQIQAVVSRDFVEQAWAELLGKSGSGFNPDTDLVGLVIPHLYVDTKKRLQSLMDQARSQDPLELDGRILKGGRVGKARRRLWESCRGPDNADGMPSSPGELLKRFRYLELDSLAYDSLDKDRAFKWCGKALLLTGDAGKLWASLLAEVQILRTTGGYISKNRLVTRLGLDYAFRPEGESDLVEGLAGLPPNCRDRIEELERWSPSVARLLVALLSRCSARTPGTLSRLPDHPPDWLEKADSLAWDAISEFVDAHDLPGLDALQGMAIKKGSPHSSSHLISQAVRVAGQGDKTRAEEILSEVPSDYPLLVVAKARIEGKAESVAELVETAELHNAKDPDLALDSVAMLVWAHLVLKQFHRLTTMLRVANERFPGRGFLLFHQANSTLGIVDQVGLESTGSQELMKAAVDLALQSRDSFRLWDGTSPLAVGVATRTLLFLDNPWRVIDLASREPDGEATVSEADDPKVRANLARAYLMLGRHEDIDPLLLQGIEPTEAELIQGMRSIDMGDPSALPLLRRVLARSDDKSSRRKALWALAMAGEVDEATLSEFEEAEVALFRGVAAFNREDMTGAINNLKPYEVESLFHAHYLAQAQFKDGDPDEAIATLTNAAEQLGDVSLYEPAARFLEEQGKYDDARGLITGALALRPFHAVRYRLMSLLVSIAKKLEDWPAVASYAQSVVDEFPHDDGAPWMVVYALHRQGKNPQAWTYLDGNDLMPPNEGLARVAIAVCRAAGGSEHDAERLLQIAEMYSESEEVAGNALLTLATRGDLFRWTEDQKARLGRRAEEFVARFPQSDVFGVYSAQTAEEAVEWVTTYLRSRSELADDVVDDVFSRVKYGLLPYGALVRLTNRPYAEVLVSLAAGWLTAIPVDEDRRARERQAAREVLNGRVSADTSVATFGLASGLDTARLGSAFKAVLMADELVFDARTAVSSAKEPVRMVGNYDLLLDQPTLTDMTADQRLTKIQKAESVLQVLEGWRRVRSGHLPPPSHLGVTERLPPWDASIRLASTDGCALWCDDLGLRFLAELEGIPAFGTWALYEALSSIPGCTWLPAPIEIKTNLLRARIADVPISLNELEQGADDSAGPDVAVDYFLRRPQTWLLNAPDTFAWYLERVKTIGEGPHRQQVAVLLYHASYGWGTSVPASDQNAVLSELLAPTILTVMDPATTPKLVVASRYAAREIKSLAQRDPMPSAVYQILNILENMVGPGPAAQTLTSLFAQTNPDDRQTVMLILLGDRR